MKRRDLEKELRKCGWLLGWHGGRHDIWTNGEDQEPVPRHNEIDEWLAKKLSKLRVCHKKGRIMNITGKYWLSEDGQVWLIV